MIYVFKRAVAATLMLLGLIGLVDGFVEWVDFVGNIIAEYQFVRDYLFSWLPFGTPNWVENYLVIGSGIASSYHRMKHESNQHSALWELVLVWMVNLILWPIIALWAILSMFIPPSDRLLKDKKYQDMITAVRSFRKNVTEVAIVYIGILFVFSDALVKLTGF